MKSIRFHVGRLIEKYQISDVGHERGIFLEMGPLSFDLGIDRPAKTIF